MTQTHRAILRELVTALDRLGADRELLATVGSWGDTMDDKAVLAELRRHNALA